MAERLEWAVKYLLVVVVVVVVETRWTVICDERHPFFSASLISLFFGFYVFYLLFSAQSFAFPFLSL